MSERQVESHPENLILPVCWSFQEGNAECRTEVDVQHYDAFLSAIAVDPREPSNYSGAEFHEIFSISYYTATCQDR